MLTLLDLSSPCAPTTSRLFRDRLEATGCSVYAFWGSGYLVPVGAARTTAQACITAAAINCGLHSDSNISTGVLCGSVVSLWTHWWHRLGELCVLDESSVKPRMGRNSTLGPGEVVSCTEYPKHGAKLRRCMRPCRWGDVVGNGRSGRGYVGSHRTVARISVFNPTRRVVQELARASFAVGLGSSFDTGWARVLIPPDIHMIDSSTPPDVHFGECHRADIVLAHDQSLWWASIAGCCGLGLKHFHVKWGADGIFRQRRP